MITTATPRKSFVLPDNAATRELKSQRIFVVWKKEKRKPSDKSTTKVPYYPNRPDHRAKSNDRRTWGSFEDAVRAYETGEFDGIGVMIALPYFYLDLDHCRDATTGVIHPDAMRIVKRLDTYWEISQGLQGLKGIAKSSDFPSVRGKNFRPDPSRPDLPKTKMITWSEGGRGGIEMYGVKGRLFCFTGNHLEGTPDDIRDAHEALFGLYHELTPPRPAPRSIDPDDVSDADRFKRCSAYVAKMPLAISESGGHNATFNVACETIRFGLSHGDAMQVLHQYNNRLDEKWSDDELEHKLAGAADEAGGERGSRLKQDRKPQTHLKIGTTDMADDADESEDAEDDLQEAEPAPSFDDDPPSKRLDVLVPGTHETGGGAIEVGNHQFADGVLSAMPRGTVYRRAGIAGEIVGPSGDRAFAPLSNERGRVLVDTHVRLIRWRTKGRGENAVEERVYPRRLNSCGGSFHCPCSRQASPD